MKVNRIAKYFPCFAPIALLGAWVVWAQGSGDALERGFQNPPDTAKPRVWWHWMNGNVTKDGIEQDLEWMKRVGIGGFQNFDAAINTPQVVEKRLIYMTPEWKDAFRYTATLADRLGLEMAIAGSPGWSESGGPWVPPAQAMKKFVWSETQVEGGKPFTGTLPKPPTVSGPFQSLKFVPRPGAASSQPPPPPPDYYADAAVVAYRAPEETPFAQLNPKLTTSGGNVTLAALTDGDLVTMNSLSPVPVGEKAWIQFEFPTAQTFRGITLVVANGARAGREIGLENGQALEASDDGREFHPVAHLINGGIPERTFAFAPATAKFFRVSFAAQPAPNTGGLPVVGTSAASGIQISELALHTGVRVNRFEDKAAFGLAMDLFGSPTPTVPAQDAVRKADVIDLTSRFHPDGTLDWTPPAGKWTVVRLGYSLLGTPNHPATPEATGLEVDKLSGPFVKAYFDKYLDMYQECVGPLMGKRGLQYVITDSWEAGAENWTDNMMAEFRKRRGYDMTPWLPVLTGHVVESAEASDRFLFDFRKTISDLTSENHYDQLTTILHARGMGRYSESHEVGRAIIADGMEVKRTADVPMSAMWTRRAPYDYNSDIRESASIAHIYGQNLVAAESMTAATGAFAYSPEILKPTADAELAMGLNRFVIHTSVHQPVNDKMPGLSLGQYGQYFTRHETWAESAKPWVSYLARSSYMLQQGKFAADVIYYYGEDSNITAMFANAPPDIPGGHDFDFANSDIVLHVLAVNNGRITTPSGMNYRLLALDANARHMPLAVLRKIRDMVNAGAAVVGPKPIDSPSLADDQAEFQNIVKQLWCSGGAVCSVGKGKVYAGQTPGQALTALRVTPDFEYTKPESDALVLFVHRTLTDGESYWVDNRRDRVESIEATFRVTGKAPELWNAETGIIEPASYRIAGGRTIVPLHLEPHEAIFVVFRKAADAQSRSLPEAVETALATVDGSWDLSFQPNRGAPARIALDKLSSWTDNAEAGVKYFSGTATYTKTVQAPADWFTTGAHLCLDLGGVKDLAEVSVNGKSLGIVWKTPFRFDVTGILKPGANAVEIKVTNLWVNRIVGDMQPNATKKYTFTAMQFYQADSPLLPSGLLGPVRVVRSVTK